MKRLSSRIIAVIGVMAALSNVLSLIYVPLVPGVNLYFLVQVPYFLVALSLGPLAGALTGLLGTLVMAYTICAAGSLGGVFVPIGNAILAGVTGFLAERVRIFERMEKGEFFWPVACAALGEFAEVPYMFATMIFTLTVLAGLTVDVAVKIIMVIMGKALLEVLISSTIIMLLMQNSSVRNLLKSLGGF